MFEELDVITKELEDIKYKKKKQIELSHEYDAKLLEQDAALKQLDKENRDVDKITGVSFTAFMSTLMNNRMEKIEKEELEALEAKQKYDAITYEVDSLKEDLALIRKEILKEKELEKAYLQAYDEKRKYVMSKSPELWEKLQMLQVDLSKTNHEVKEIKEAVNACTNVQRSLNIAIKELNDARALGAWDMLGGGMLATMAKRDHMNKAQAAINDLNYKLKRFSKELKDINETVEMEINISQFLSFADYFFDGLFVDIMVQNKIKEAQAKVETLEIDINRLEQKLNTMYMNTEAHRKHLKTTIDEYVLNN